MSLIGLATTTWRCKLPIACFLAIGVGVGIYVAYFVYTPIYRSTAIVILDTIQHSPVLDLQNLTGDDGSDLTDVNNETQPLRSRNLMESVVLRLDLQKDPEFNIDLRPVSQTEQWKSARIDDLIRFLGLRSTSGPKPQIKSNSQFHLDTTVTTLLKQTSVQSTKGSLVFRITSLSNDPEKARLIADAIAAQYIAGQITAKRGAVDQSTNWLRERMAELKIHLEESATSIASFKATIDLVSPEVIEDTKVELNEIHKRLEQAEEARDTLELDLQNHAASETRYDTLIARVRQNLNNTNFQVAALDAYRIEVENQLATQSSDLITQQQLVREVDATRSLYEYFLTRLKETAALQGIQQADSRILSNAVVARVPAKPNRPLLVALSSAITTLIGLGLVVFRVATRTSGFLTAVELEQKTGITVLGQVPIIPTRKRQRVLDYLISQPTSAAAEALRDLRTSLSLSSNEISPQIIVSTSSMPGEGKTTNALALAQNLGLMGQKVLLIDGDIRQRTLCNYFNREPSHGIVSVLMGDKTNDNVVQHFPREGFDVIFAEKTRINAVDIFSSSNFGGFLTDQRRAYDTIIIDTPPILITSDSRVIGQFADATLFSVKWNSTTQPQVTESLRLIQNSNQKVAGFILGQINVADMNRYGYKGSYGAYSAYGT